MIRNQYTRRPDGRAGGIEDDPVPDYQAAAALHKGIFNGLLIALPFCAGVIWWATT